MAMNGIDISSWQADLDVSKIKAKFVVVKATEGIGYVNPQCDKHVQQAFESGKKAGVYHFARNTINSPEDEAEFFWKHTQGYNNKVIYVLDWEDGIHDVAWAKRFLDHFAKLSGKKAMIYMSESVVNSYDWSSVAAGDYGLWVAKYRDYALDYNYDMSFAGQEPVVKWWNGYAMWQWTSSGNLDGYGGNLDLNEFYGDESAWDKYAGGSAGSVVTASAPAPVVQAVQAEETYVVQSGDSLSAIAAKYGVTWQHLQAVNGIANPNLIYPGQQLRIGKAVQSRTYVVQSGDSLSSIAGRFGTDWKTLQNINGIANANLIYPGQTIRLP